VRDIGLSLKNKVAKTNLFYMIGKGWGHHEITKLFSQTACYRRTCRHVADGKWTGNICNGTCRLCSMEKEYAGTAARGTDILLEMGNGLLDSRLDD